MFGAHQQTLPLASNSQNLFQAKGPLPNHRAHCEKIEMQNWRSRHAAGILRGSGRDEDLEQAERDEE